MIEIKPLAVLSYKDINGGLHESEEKALKRNKEIEAFRIDAEKRTGLTGIFKESLRQYPLLSIEDVINYSESIRKLLNTIHQVHFGNI